MNKVKKARKTKQEIDSLKNTILNTINSLKEFFPITLRTLYYQLVKSLVIENKQSEYQMLSNRKDEMLMTGLISDCVFVDRSRTFYNCIGYDNIEEHIENIKRKFVTSYYRNLMQGQETYIEVWIEKDALSSMVIPIVEKYTIPLVICRGYLSTTFKNNYEKRIRNNGKKNIILYMGDQDPSGVDMAKGYVFDDSTLYRIALNDDQIDMYDLPINVNAIKKNDTRYNSFINKFDRAVELDALHPKDLQNILERNILKFVDIDLINKQRQIEKTDIEYLENIKIDI